MLGRDNRGRVLAALLVASCAVDDGDEDADGSSTTAAMTSTSGEMESTSTTDVSTSSPTTGTDTPTTSAGVTSAATTLPPTAGEEEGDDTSTGEPLPEGPSCSVQVTTHGELFDPLPKGEEAGLFPTSVGEALEDYCGCHTLSSNAQNVHHPGLLAPGGSLFLEYADMSRGFGGGTLGQAIAEEVQGYAMPPGSCSYPPDPAAVLEKWFEDGLPDGANFTPP